MTKDALINAMRVVLAVGGSPDALVHLPAIARGKGFKYYWFRLGVLGFVE